MGPPFPSKVYGIEYLYHLTSIQNLSSILTYGLRSNYFVHRHKLVTVDISDPQVQEIRRNKTVKGLDLHRYVPLYFSPRNPMLCKRQGLQEEIILLAINPLVLLDDETVFSDGNAACHETRFYWRWEKLALLDWGVINSPNWSELPDGKRIKCAEVLVYPHIPSSQIIKIFTNSPWVLEEVKQRLGKRPITSELNQTLYFN